VKRERALLPDALAAVLLLGLLEALHEVWLRVLSLLEVREYTLEKTLGSGFSAKVKLASDPQGNQYALKIFDLTNP
jgi:hypothetical protein